MLFPPDLPLKLCFCFFFLHVCRSSLRAVIESCPIRHLPPACGMHCHISEDGGNERGGGGIVHAPPSQRRSNQKWLKKGDNEGFRRGGLRLPPLPHLAKHYRLEPLSVFILRPTSSSLAGGSQILEKCARAGRSQRLSCRASWCDLPGSGNTAATAVTTEGLLVPQ